jgi:hypothetical protein
LSELPAPQPVPPTSQEPDKLVRATKLLRAKQQVAAIKCFYVHLLVFVLVVAGLLGLKLMLGSPWLGSMAISWVGCRPGDTRLRRFQASAHARLQAQARPDLSVGRPKDQEAHGRVTIAAVHLNLLLVVTCDLCSLSSQSTMHCNASRQ